MIVTPVIRFRSSRWSCPIYVVSYLCRVRPLQWAPRVPQKGRPGGTPLQLSLGPTSDNDQTRRRFSQVHQLDASVHANHGLRVDNEQKQNPRRAASRPYTSLPPA
jgi:hypothetical protein